MAKEHEEQTLVIVKPDGVERRIVGDIIARFEKVGLTLAAMKMVHADEEIVGDHYAENKEWLESVGAKARKAAEERGDEFNLSDLEHGQKIREQLMGYLTMGPVVAMVLEGPSAVGLVRKIVGSTEPGTALPGTIRGDYALDTYRLSDAKNRAVYNLIHASGDEKEAEREIAIWFQPEEITR